MEFFGDATVPATLNACASQVNIFVGVATVQTQRHAQVQNELFSIFAIWPSYYIFG